MGSILAVYSIVRVSTNQHGLSMGAGANVNAFFGIMTMIIS
ncbi:hypothetical protein L505_1362, partial [Bordetella bronchiseptica F4563]